MNLSIASSPGSLLVHMYINIFKYLRTYIFIWRFILFIFMSWKHNLPSMLHASLTLQQIINIWFLFIVAQNSTLWEDHNNQVPNCYNRLPCASSFIYMTTSYFYTEGLYSSKNTHFLLRETEPTCPPKTWTNLSSSQQKATSTLAFW